MLYNCGVSQIPSKPLNDLSSIWQVVRNTRLLGRYDGLVSEAALVVGYVMSVAKVVENLLDDIGQYDVGVGRQWMRSSTHW